jgi:hypothetical protein
MGMGESADVFPTIYRFGFTYLVDISQAQRLQIAGDAVKQDWNHRSWGYHLGTELQLPLIPLPAALRAGAYYQSGVWRFTVGGGIRKSISDRLEVQVDYAHEFRATLDDDERFAARLAYGIIDDAANRHRSAEQALAENRSFAKEEALEALACYPYVNQAELTAGGTSPVIDAAILLGDSLDTERRERYAEFIGKSYYARQQVQEARRLLRLGENASACMRARNAVEAFKKKVKNPDVKDSLLWAEAYLILAEVCPQDAAESARNALGLFPINAAGGMVRYMRGRSWQLLGGTAALDSAAQQFALVESGGDEEPLYILALVGRAACVTASDNPPDPEVARTLIDLLKTKVAGYRLGQLDPEYPPYPVYTDYQLADDAQLFIGDLYKDLNETDKARAAYADVCRFYPSSEQCRNGHADQRLEELAPKP